MTKTELLEMIRNGESSGLEFKRDPIDNRALAKELVAFANLAGGSVLLGVDDDGSVSGTTRDAVEEWVMTACRTKIRPEIIPYFEMVKDVEPGKDVAVVRVEPGFSVHQVWHDQHSSYYIRVGSQSREASAEELARLFQQRGAFSIEARPVNGSSMAELDRRRLRDYFVRVRAQEAPAEEDDDGWRALLANTEFVETDAPGGAATVGGLLLFGIAPNRFLRHAGIAAAAYPGTVKDYATHERAELRGPMVPLMSARGQLVESGLVEQALDFCKRNLSPEARIVDGQRVDQWPYPLDALREVIVNALVHRDYLLSATDIELSLYTDRLECISPGRLPNGITPARMRAGCRAARNQLLKDVMRDYNYLEHMGMGVPRKIIRLMVEQNGREPDLLVEDETFTVRLGKRGP
jgi:ATP-dependent DNA helicase RecG